MADTLSLRALNRALLARQMLLGRASVTPLAAIEQLGGLQGQEARHPFVALWARLEGFQPAHLRDLIRQRDVVRATWIRGTLHHVTRADYIRFRTTLQPVLTAGMLGIFKNRKLDLDIGPVVAAAREVYAGAGPLPFGALREALAARFPDIDERMLGFGVRCAMALIIADDDTAWSYKADGAFGPAEAWLGETISQDVDLEGLALRYLAAFGPATVADFQNWSGLAGQKATFEGIRGRCVVFRDERKRELFDLSDAPRPDEATPAPPRLLAEFDTALLGHADRSRIVPERYKKALQSNNLRVPAVILVDGFVAGIWTCTVKRGEALATLQLFEDIPQSARKALRAEGEAAARFLAPEAKAWGSQMS
ncbi:MAG: winged helix DNA-binding domain-containing protein [Caulobacteraceae bacterium]